jgi:putative peptidoglycan lipid II flippase
MARPDTSASAWTGNAARARLLAALGLAALLGGMFVIVTGSGGADGGSATTSAAATTQTTTPVKPAPKPVTAVRLGVRGVGAYDPEGDRSENDSQAAFATDGNPTTAWKTEHYLTSFHKSGVGLVLDAGRPVKATRLVLTTDTPGYSARIRVSDAAGGPFTAVSGSKTTTARTVFALRPVSARYVLVWVTSMPPGGVAAVNEVAVSGRR